MVRVHVIGVGPGGKEYITPAAMRAVEEADILVGGERNLALFNWHKGETFTIKNNLSEMVDFIKIKIVDKKIAVLASGDPGMFGILPYLRKHFVPGELNVIPGISSVQYACARLAIPWHDATVVSTHGRARGIFIEAVRLESKVIALAGPDEQPRELALALVEAGVTKKRIHICSDLSYPAEEIKSYTLNRLASLEEHWKQKNYVMVIEDE